MKIKLNRTKVLIAALCVVTVASVTCAGVVCSKYVNNRPTEYYWESLARKVSPNILMEYGDRGDEGFVRLKDVRTGKYTTPKLQHVFINEYDAEDSLVVFRTHDRLRGYLNVNTGKIIIPAQYNRAWNFSDGLAAVLKDGVVSFVNAEGEPAFPATFPIFYDDDYSEIAFQFHDGLCVMRTLDGKWGLINARGEWVVEPHYNSINAPVHGCRIVTDGSRYGLLNAEGKEILPVEYDFIRVASDERGFVLAKDGYAKEVDWNLQTLVPFVYDGLYELEYVGDRTHEYDETDGGYHRNVPTYWRYDIGKWSGVMDLDGNVIIPARYYMVRNVDDTRFEVEVTCGGDRILFNTKGQPIGKSAF